MCSVAPVGVWRRPTAAPVTCPWAEDDVMLHVGPHCEHAPPGCKHQGVVFLGEVLWFPSGLW